MRAFTSAGKVRPPSDFPGTGFAMLTVGIASSRVSARSSFVCRQRGSMPSTNPTTNKTKIPIAHGRNRGRGAEDFTNGELLIQILESRPADVAVQEQQPWFCDGK